MHSYSISDKMIPKTSADAQEGTFLFPEDAAQAVLFSRRG